MKQFIDQHRGFTVVGVRQSLVEALHKALQQAAEAPTGRQAFCELPLEVAPEPLLAPPGPGRWKTLWSSEAKRYGGAGEVAVESKTGWTIPAEAAVVLRPVRSA
jgi:hypothetical protein